MKNTLGNLIGSTLNLQMALGSIVIFTILIFQSKNMAYLSFCIFFSSIVSYSFSEYRLFASLGRFIPRYFILFAAVVNGIVSLISPSDFFVVSV